MAFKWCIACIRILVALVKFNKKWVTLVHLCVLSTYYRHHFKGPSSSLCSAWQHGEACNLLCITAFCCMAGALPWQNGLNRILEQNFDILFKYSIIQWKTSQFLRSSSEYIHEKTVKRMRWRALFFLKEDNEKYSALLI